MRKIIYLASTAAVAVGFWCFTRPTAGANETRSGMDQTQAVVQAANDFLSGLSAEQRKTVQFEFLRPAVATPTQFDFANMRRGPGGAGDGKGGAGGGQGGAADGKGGQGSPGPGQGRAGNGGQGGPGNGQGGPPASGEQYGKAVWSNFPINITKRPGIELGSLNAMQRAAVMHLLQLILSPAGYEKVQEIMGSDQALADAGTDVTAGADHYLIGIFGTPDDSKPWMVEFGGHHLGLNVVIDGPRGAMTPTLTGAQPAVYTKDGKTVRVLAGENDKAFDLLNTLDASQRKKAILNYHVGDLVLGPGHDGQSIVPEGLKGSEMTPAQRQALLGLIAEWAGIINDAYLQSHMDEIRAGLDETWFAWSGPTTHAAGRNGTAYYRIQGPRVVIEFAPQATMGDPDNHVHTIYRDPKNEYGSSYTTQ